MFKTSMVVQRIYEHSCYVYRIILALLSIPFLVLTHGLILYPFWIVIHIMKIKKIVKEFGVDHINSEAEELVKKFSDANNENHNADR